MRELHNDEGATPHSEWQSLDITLTPSIIMLISPSLLHFPLTSCSSPLASSWDTWIHLSTIQQMFFIDTVHRRSAGLYLIAASSGVLSPTLNSIIFISFLKKFQIKPTWHLISAAYKEISSLVCTVKHSSSTTSASYCSSAWCWQWWDGPLLYKGSYHCQLCHLYTPEQKQALLLTANQRGAEAELL